MSSKPVLQYDVRARRIDAHGSIAACKDAEITLDTDIAGAPTPSIQQSCSSPLSHLHGERQDSPPKMVNITYELVVDTAEPDRRLDLLHENVRKFGTIYNTVAGATNLAGTIRRAAVVEKSGVAHG